MNFVTKILEENLSFHYASIHQMPKMSSKVCQKRKDLKLTGHSF